MSAYRFCASRSSSSPSSSLLPKEKFDTTEESNEMDHSWWSLVPKIEVSSSDYDNWGVWCSGSTRGFWVGCSQ